MVKSWKCGVSTPVVCHLPKVEKPVRFWHAAHMNQDEMERQLKILKRLRVMMGFYTIGASFVALRCNDFYDFVKHTDENNS